MRSFILLVVCAVTAYGVPHGSTFLKVNREVRSEAVCCRGRAIKSCFPAEVNPQLLRGESEILVEGYSLKYTNKIWPYDGTSTHDTLAYNYLASEAASDSSAVLVFNPAKQSVHGHLYDPTNAKSFVLEFCGESGHVWKEIELSELPSEAHPMAPARHLNFPLHPKEKSPLTKKGKEDKTTASIYSIKVYYTPDFADATPDIDGIVDLAVAETNQGYRNSEVPNSCQVICQELATINDIQDGSTFLSNFRNMKSSVVELRDSADAAVLLALDFESCGIGYVDTTDNGLTLSITMKSCATGYYSFGHEIGHNYGCAHNPEATSNGYYPYGFAHLIEQGSASKGYRTILAYTYKGHETRVNYYSNPAITYPTTGTSTGVDGLSENARVITENRFNMEGLGDESSCSGQRR